MKDDHLTFNIVDSRSIHTPALTNRNERNETEEIILNSSLFSPELNNNAKTIDLNSKNSERPTGIINIEISSNIISIASA